MISQIAPLELARRMDELPLLPCFSTFAWRKTILPPTFLEAKNNCVYEVSFSERMSDLASTKDVVCVYGADSDNHEARMAAEKLLRAGYPEVLELRAGLDGWRSAGLEVKSEGAADPAPLDGWREIDLRGKQGGSRASTRTSSTSTMARSPSKLESCTLFAVSSRAVTSLSGYADNRLPRSYGRSAPRRPHCTPPE